MSGSGLNRLSGEGIIFVVPTHMKHKHRLLPGHMGGQYVDGNVVTVEVIKCDRETSSHAMWHYANWMLHGKEEDKIAWKALAGFYNKEKIIEEINILNGKRSGEINKQSGHIVSLGQIYGAIAMSPGGWLYENRVEYARKAGLTSYPKGLGLMTYEERVEIARRNWEEGKGLATMTKEQRREAGMKGGKIGGQTTKERGVGVCGIPPEEHSNRMSETNRQKWVCPECGYTGSAKSVNRHMLECHKLPKTSKYKEEPNG